MSWGQEETPFTKANNAYADGNYAEAKRLYQNIVKEENVSGELFFNLANTYYKLEDVANSIYYYEKALKLNPNDEAITNNLSFANRMRLDQFEKIPASEVDQNIKGFINLFSIDGWSIVGIIFLIIALAGFVVFLFNYKPNLKRLALGLCIIFILISGASFSLAQTQLNNKQGEVFGIIFQKEKSLLEEPNPKSNALVTLHEGTKIKILDQFRTYYKVKLPDGTEGWMTTENIKKI
jgi:tetratricopeptide (TPR) repeat protein